MSDASSNDMVELSGRECGSCGWHVRPKERHCYGCGRICPAVLTRFGRHAASSGVLIGCWIGGVSAVIIAALSGGGWENTLSGDAILMFGWCVGLAAFPVFGILGLTGYLFDIEDLVDSAIKWTFLVVVGPVICGVVAGVALLFATTYFVLSFVFGSLVGGAHGGLLGATVFGGTGEPNVDALRSTAREQLQAQTQAVQQLERQVTETPIGGTAEQDLERKNLRAQLAARERLQRCWQENLDTTVRMGSRGRTELSSREGECDVVVLYDDMNIVLDASASLVP